MFRKIKTIIFHSLDNHILQHAAGLAYTSLFSLAPVLLLIIGLSGIFLGPTAAEGKLVEQIQYFTGNNGAEAVQSIIRNASFGNRDWWAVLTGGFFFLVGATAIFAQMKVMLNIVWSVSPDPVSGNWLYTLKSRLMALALVISLGVLFLVFLLASAILTTFGDYISTPLFVPKEILGSINLFVTFLVMASFFTGIFRLLPDVRIQWSDAAKGALVTTILFLIGRYFIFYCIEQTSLSKVYGITGSLLGIMLWAYYSALVIFIGTALTRSYIETKNHPVHLRRHGMWMERKFSKERTPQEPKASVIK